MQGKIWTKEEIEFLKTNWGKISSKEVMKFYPNKSYKAVSGKALRLGISKSKSQKKWIDYEIKYLKNNCSLLSGPEIAKILNRSYQSVKSYANKTLKINLKKVNKGNLKALLEDTNENWYWLGFIAADGYLSKQYLTITLNSKDTNHLKILANKLNVNINITNKGYSTIGVSDTKYIKDLKLKIGQLSSDPKTYNPLNINYNISNENFLSFIIGFIDGDGCIEVKNNKMRQLKIECHSSWFNNLVFISEFLRNNYNIPSKTIITSRGYTLWKITSHQNGVNLRNVMKRLDIPYLKRKWDVFSDNIEKTNFYRKIELKVIELYRENKSLKEISKILNVNYHSLYNHKKELLTKI